MAGCLQNTGEGALSPYHRNGGDLVFQIGTGYFGCRDEDGTFDLARLTDLVASAPVRAIEIKLSQGAKPGLGGMLPGAKVSQEIAEIRGIEPGVDCASPSRHRVFHDVDSMLDFVETVADATGLPVGIKSAVGNLEFWDDLVRLMAAGRPRASTSSTSTAARAAPARRRWSSPTRWPTRSGSASPRSTAGSRGRARRRRHLHRRRQAGHPRERRRRVRARRRHGQRGPRGDVRARLHPGPEVPHRPLPDRRRDPEPSLHPRPRPHSQERSPGQLRAHAAARPAEGLRGRRRRPPGADHPRRRRRRRGDRTGPGRCARSTATSPSGASWDRALHAGDRRA